jgi:hypothetical protein
VKKETPNQPNPILQNKIVPEVQQQKPKEAEKPKKQNATIDPLFGINSFDEEKNKKELGDSSKSALYSLFQKEIEVIMKTDDSTTQEPPKQQQQYNFTTTFYPT